MSAPIGMTQTELDDFIPADVEYTAGTVMVDGRQMLVVGFDRADRDRMVPDLPEAIVREYDEGHGDRITEGWFARDQQLLSTQWVELCFPGSYFED